MSPLDRLRSLSLRALSGGALCFMLVGCYGTRHHAATEVGVTQADQVYGVDTHVPVGDRAVSTDRWGVSHEPEAVLTPEPRPDMAIAQSVDTDEGALPDVPVEDAEDNKPWWQKIGLSGSITFGVSTRL